MNKILKFIFIIIIAIFFLNIQKINNSDIINGNIKDNIFLISQKENPVFNFNDLKWISYSTTTMWEKRDSHSAFIFQDKMWILGGLDADMAIENGESNYEKAKYYNDIWWTEDGLKWIRGIEHANFPPIRSASVFEKNGKLFMIGGYSPDPKVHYKNGLWTSDDGINWKKENIILPWKEREGQKIIKFKNNYLMIGGVNYINKQRFNDIWTSSDGYNWSILATSTAWEPRWDMEISDFNSKLWLTGGMTSIVKNFGDEWVSDDGINWTLVYQNAPFGKRQGSTSIVSDGYLILIGGIKQDNDSIGEVWITKDGLKWEQQITNWTAREDASSLLFKNRIWILGGMNYNQVWSNDIFYSDYQYFNGETINLETFKQKIFEDYILYKGKCPLSNSAISSEELSKTFVNKKNRLPENFVPRDLVDLDKIIKNTKGDICLDRIAGDNLIKMFKQAESENIFLGVSSGYRSPERQQKLFDFEVEKTNLEEAIKGIAEPYHSEHQLGIAVDLTGESIDYLGVSKKFANSDEANWLENNAHLFGFILSYPDNKSDITDYIYEPWHYRYIGKEVAKYLYDKKITFTEYCKYSLKCVSLIN
ncbi:MAG: M15 family metallopeptidase [bacterium]